MVHKKDSCLWREGCTRSRVTISNSSNNNPRNCNNNNNNSIMEAVAKHDFNATADDELSFRKNQVLKVSAAQCYFSEIFRLMGFVKSGIMLMGIGYGRITR